MGNGTGGRACKFSCLLEFYFKNKNIYSVFFKKIKKGSEKKGQEKGYLRRDDVKGYR